MKLFGIALLFVGLSHFALAQIPCIELKLGCPAPEIDPSSVGSAVALLSGTLLILRGRRTK